jgi:hypothetical protein
MTARDAETLARRFHETYERLAPQFGYETRPASAKPWAEVPEANRQLMVAVAREILQAADPTPSPDGREAAPDAPGPALAHQLETWWGHVCVDMPDQLAPDPSLVRAITAALRTPPRALPPPLHDLRALRELIIRADSYLSLLWHRYAGPAARADVHLQWDVERTIGNLRSLGDALTRLAPP